MFVLPCVILNDGSIVNVWNKSLTFSCIGEYSDSIFVWVNSNRIIILDLLFDGYCLSFCVPISDAICIICQHSKCVEEILEKRKVTKRYLCEYLHRSKVSIHNSWDKPALIRKTLNFWKLEASSSSLKDDATENLLPEENQVNEYIGF